MKDGVIQYLCKDPAACPGGTVQGISGNSYTVQSGYFALSPAQITTMDPLHLGPNAPVLKYLNTWPKSNSSSCGDGFNYTCFNFRWPISNKKNENITKPAYNITRDPKNHVSF